MSDPTITCPQCGNSMPAGGRFCTNCGHIIESPVEQPPAEIIPAMPEATEPGMPGESIAMSTEADGPGEGAAILSGSIESTQDQGSSDSPPALTSNDAQPDQPDPVAGAEAITSPPPESWYASLASSPGEGTTAPPELGTLPTGSRPEAQATVESAPEATLEAAEPLTTPSTSSFTPPPDPTIYTPPPTSSQWQPGAYDIGATQPVDIPIASPAPPAPPAGAAPGQTQSIFSPPPPPNPAQGQYTQPISPQQGYSPPPQQTFAPPPAYNNQPPPPSGTQPLAPGQSYPGYQQYQPGYPAPQQAVAPKDPTTALLLELLGFLGFLGIGHIYAGKTNRGIALLIGWIVYLIASGVLTICLVGCFMFLAIIIVPPLSGLWVKNEMEKERLTGFRQ